MRGGAARGPASPLRAGEARVCGTEQAGLSHAIPIHNTACSAPRLPVCPYAQRMCFPEFSGVESREPYGPAGAQWRYSDVPPGYDGSLRGDIVNQVFARLCHYEVGRPIPSKGLSIDGLARGTRWAASWRTRTPQVRRSCGARWPRSRPRAGSTARRAPYCSTCRSQGRFEYVLSAEPSNRESLSNVRQRVP